MTVRPAAPDTAAYLALLRGINVGGRNKVPMKVLKARLEDSGYQGVSTYIASGNVFLTAAGDPDSVARDIEAVLLRSFDLDDELVKVLVLNAEQLQAVVGQKPEGFGERPDLYHSDAVFLMDIDADAALAAFRPREGVDQVWAGDGVIYSQRLSAELSKSRLNAVTASPLYKSMTIRSWNTTQKLADLLPG